MGLIVIALLIVWAAVGALVVQNADTVHVTLLSYGWDVPMWAPTVVAVAATSALLLLTVIAAGLGHQVRTFGHRRTIAELDDENARLRDQLRGRTASATTPRDWRGWFRRMRTS